MPLRAWKRRRFRLILSALERLGTADVAVELRSAWDDFVSITDERPDAEYALCYLDALLKELVTVTLGHADAKGMRPGRSKPRPASEVELNPSAGAFKAHLGLIEHLGLKEGKVKE